MSVRSLSNLSVLQRQTQVFEKPGFRLLEDQVLKQKLQQGYNSQYYQSIDPYKWLGNAHSRHRGQGVRVAVMDTGIHLNHPCQKVANAIDFTNDNDVSDFIGHGTFITGIIGSTCSCQGISPDSEVFVLKVYDKQQESRTKWALDALNYVTEMDIDVQNQSMGGPDHLDVAYTEKIEELQRKGVIIISAIGNDGPTFGSLSNPGDMLGVIGVGSASLLKKETKWSVSSFSSRGEVAWTLPLGAGRSKPDILAPGMNLFGLASCPKTGGCDRKCRMMSGTSMSTPVITAVIANMLSIYPKQIQVHNQQQSRKHVLTSSLIRKILMSTATRLENAAITEQGAGLLNYNEAMKEMLQLNWNLQLPFTRYNAPALIPGSVFTMKAHPCTIDSNEMNYTDMIIPLFYTQNPLLLNITQLQPLYGHAKLQRMEYTGNAQLRVQLQSPVLFSTSTYLDVNITTTRDVTSNTTAEGMITLTYLVQSVFSRNPQTQTNQRKIVIPVSLLVIPTPLKQKRVLFSAYHQVVYPQAYVPRDDLGLQQDLLDWYGDHLRTNYRGWAQLQMRKGYHIDILTKPLDEGNLHLYSCQLLIDTEKGFSVAEVAAVQKHVASTGQHVIVFADWYNEDIIQSIRFYDTNTASTWVPVTGGANIPAQNTLLHPYGIALGSKVYRGPVRLHGIGSFYASGTSIVKFPKGGRLAFSSVYDVTPQKPNSSNMTDKTSTTTMQEEVADFFLEPNLSTQPPTTLNPQKVVVPILGVVRPEGYTGSIAVYGDSNCLDLAHRTGAHCHGLQYRLIDTLSTHSDDVDLPPLENTLKEDYNVMEADTRFQSPLNGFVRDSSAVIHPHAPLLQLWSQIFQCEAPIHRHSMKLQTVPQNRRYIDQASPLYSPSATVWAREALLLMQVIRRRSTVFVVLMQELGYVLSEGVICMTSTNTPCSPGQSERILHFTHKLTKLFISNVIVAAISSAKLLSLEVFPIALHHASVVQTASSVITDCTDCVNTSNSWCELKYTGENFIFCDVLEPLFQVTKPLTPLVPKKKPTQRMKLHTLTCPSVASFLLKTQDNTKTSCNATLCYVSSKHQLPLHYTFQQACHIPLPTLTKLYTATSVPQTASIPKIHRKSKPASTVATVQMSVENLSLLRRACESVLATSDVSRHTRMENIQNKQLILPQSPLAQIWKVMTTTSSRLLLAIFICMMIGGIIVFTTFCASQCRWSKKRFVTSY